MLYVVIACLAHFLPVHSYRTIDDAATGGVEIFETVEGSGSSSVGLRMASLVLALVIDGGRCPTEKKLGAGKQPSPDLL
ncbi:hypothetical protein OAG60_01000 [bacterium]|nr:hypothetical protein [bacterium]